MTLLVPRNLDDKGESTESSKSIQRVSTSEKKRNNVSRTPTGTGDGKDVPDHKIIGGEIGASRSMKTGQKNA